MAKSVTWQPTEKGTYHLVRLSNAEEAAEDYLLREKCGRCKQMNAFLCEHNTNIRAEINSRSHHDDGSKRLSTREIKAAEAMDRHNQRRASLFTVKRIEEKKTPKLDKGKVYEIRNNSETISKGAKKGNNTLVSEKSRIVGWGPKKNEAAEASNEAAKRKTNKQSCSVL